MDGRLQEIEAYVAASKSACTDDKTISLPIGDVNFLLNQVHLKESLQLDYVLMERQANNWVKSWQEERSENSKLRKEIMDLKSMRRIGKYLKINAENLALSQEIEQLKRKLEKVGCHGPSCSSRSVN